MISARVKAGQCADIQVLGVLSLWLTRYVRLVHRYHYRSVIMQIQIPANNIFFFVPLPNVLLYSLAAVEIYNIYEGTLFLPSLTHTYFFFPLVLRFIYLSLSLSLCLYLCAHIHGALWRYRTRLLRSHTADAICISRLSDSCGGALYLQEITLLEDKAALLNRRKRKMVK